ncbi:DUF736 family protein [Parvibaculum sp.]|uniref:DUF736 domain-containing protein n=1 Tax=Parvibaculum sp. TaxID=2024848 RepID=UPI0034374271
MNRADQTLHPRQGWRPDRLHPDAHHRRQVRLVPNDDRNGDNAPAFRALVGNARIGDAWDARTAGDNPRYYLRVRLDAPSLTAPLRLSLFPCDEGRKARLVWNRGKER